MNSALLGVLAIFAFVLGYRFYSRILAERVFRLGSGKTPAQALKDGVDYVPTRRAVLLGHHYASIAGAAPIVGPAVAVIWGWLPALIWVVLGSIFLGAVHDFGTLVVSMKHQGKSMGFVTEKVLGPQVRTGLLLVIFFLVWMVIAVFALVIANLFVSYPSTVIPVNFQIVVALLMGFTLNRKGEGNLLLPSILAQVVLWGMIYFGVQNPISLATIFGESEILVWIGFLMAYSYIASTLPVWLLLQPRDYINSHLLFLGLGGLILGLFLSQPQMTAPALNLTPEGAPPWFPFLFITIACGAISGFHGLVSGGTTSKQVATWRDCRPIGYGGMLGEGLLALLATLAVSTGFDSVGDWHRHYGTWDGAKGLSASLGAFVTGAGKFLGGLGVPEEFGQTVIAVLIISFAATSLDTAARIQRYIVGELGESWELPVLKNRFIGGGIAILTALFLMFLKSGGKGGLILWPLFGATNQMLAGLSLVVISAYLYQKKRPYRLLLFPAIFVSIMTTVGLSFNIRSYFIGENYFLTALGAILLLVQVGMTVAAGRRILFK